MQQVCRQLLRRAGRLPYKMTGFFQASASHTKTDENTKTP
jgi:hypothetical protein